MEPNYILGLTKRHLGYGQPIRAGWVIDAGSGDFHINMGTPCLVLKASENNEPMASIEKSDRKVVLLPFSINTGESSYNRLILDNHKNIRNLAIRVGEETDFFDCAKELVVDRIDLGKLTRAVEFTKDTGPLTLLVNDTNRNRLTTNLQQMVADLAKKYLLTLQGRWSHSNNHGLIAGDNCYLAITIMDIRQCIPVFHPSMVDGIVLNVTTYYTEASKQTDNLRSSCEFTFYFSNFKENLTAIDGQTLSRKVSSASKLDSIVLSLSSYFRDVGKSVPKKEINKKKSDAGTEKSSRDEAGLKEKPITIDFSDHYFTMATTATTATTTDDNMW